MKKIVLLFCLVQPFLANAILKKGIGPGKVIYVAKSGDDTADGSLLHPLLTINRALSKIEPGDQVIIRKGIYRELVTLNQGGTAEAEKVTIKAATGEIVSIKGSEQVKTWTRENNGLWNLVVDTGAFKGLIFFNEVKMQRKDELNQLYRSVLSWAAQNRNDKVLIKANFGKNNPNIGLTEVVVRSSGISALANVNYVHLEGIQVSQVFSTEATIYGKQAGAIETGGGMHWTIQNCTIRDCSAVGISIGHTGRTYPEANPGDPEFSNYKELAAVGHHIIRNNHISRCGQAGIFGLAGGTASLIEGNLVEDINTDGAYSGTEAGGIRLALAIDVIIKGNLIRKIKGESGYGIYIGPLFQAARISENIIADTGTDALYLFNSHGPALVDHNVLAPGDPAGKLGVKMLASEANVFIDNLFYNCRFANERRSGRSVATSNYLPHTLVIKQTIPSLDIDHRWFGNTFIKQRLDIPACTDCKIDYNAFINDAGFSLIQTPTGAAVQVNFKEPAPVHLEFNAEFIGFFALSKQYLEYPNGNPKLPTSFSLVKK